MAENSLPTVFTDEEVRQLILARCHNGATEKDIERWVNWCEQIRMAQAFIDLCLEGELSVKWDQDSPEPQFYKLGNQE